MKPVQYLFVGLPYSGKTTLACELEKKLGFARINIDELKISMGYGNVSDDEVPDEMWDEIFKIADKQIIKYLIEEKSVLNEYAWVSKEWRDRARKAAGNFETKIIYIDVPLDVIWKRWEENEIVKIRFQLTKDELKRSFIEFEPLNKNDNIIFYDQTVPLDKWINDNFPQA